MSTTATQLAPWIERNPDVHPGTPGSYQCFLHGVVILQATEKAILIAQAENHDRKTWVSLKSIGGGLFMADRRYVRDLLVKVWLYRKLREEMQ